jgi:hypothetical protein
MTDEPLTGRLARLAQADLDVDEGKARAAADVLCGFLRRFNEWHVGLEEAAGALERSASTSTRAMEARDHLGMALNNCHDVVVFLADAQDALDLHWNREPTP